MLVLFVVLSVVNAVMYCVSIQKPLWMEALWFIFYTLLSFLVISLLYVFILWIITLFFDKKKEKKENNPFMRFILKEACGMVMFFTWTTVHITGKEKIPDGTFLLVGNHRSGFDPIATIWALRDRRLNFVSKRSNFDIPIGGPLMEECGFLAIDREDDRKALKTINTVADRMREGVCSFGIYPEGTRNHGKGLLPFRNGCFKAAQKAEVPIVVVTTQNTNQIRRRAPWRPTTVEMNVCGVLDKEYVMSHKTFEIGELVQQMMLASLKDD